MKNLKALERLWIPFLSSRCLCSDFPFLPRRQINSTASNDGTVRQRHHQIYTLASPQIWKASKWIIFNLLRPVKVGWVGSRSISSIEGVYVESLGWNAELHEPPAMFLLKSRKKFHFEVVQALVKYRQSSLTSSPSQQTSDAFPYSQPHYSFIRINDVVMRREKFVSLFDLTSEEVYTWHFYSLHSLPFEAGGYIYQTLCDPSTKSALERRLFVYLYKKSSFIN